MEECCGEGRCFAVGDVVVDLEEASVVEAEVAVVGVAECGGGGEEGGGLAVDDFEVSVQCPVVSGQLAGAFLLEEFGFDHCFDCVADKSRGLLVADFVEEFHDFGEVVVADEDGYGVVPAGVDGGLVAAGGGAVDDVVVEEGGVVEHFDADGEEECAA